MAHDQRLIRQRDGVVEYTILLRGRTATYGSHTKFRNLGAKVSDPGAEITKYVEIYTM